MWGTGGLGLIDGFRKKGGFDKSSLLVDSVVLLGTAVHFSELSVLALWNRAALQ